MEACRCVRQACLGLQHAHDHGLVHRDLKPQNLMLTSDKGIIKILDFGLAKVVSENKDARGLTKANVTMGTYEYAAPEQALDAARADIRADIYSLGCTLYYLIAGVLPFAHNSDVQLLMAHQNETPRSLREVCPETPRELSDLVARMLAKKPADRPQTPADVAKALLPFAKGQGQIMGAVAQIEAAAEASAKLQPIARPSGRQAKRMGFPGPLAGTGPRRKTRLAQLWHRCQSAIPPRFRTRGWLVAAAAAALGGIVLFGVLIKMQTPDGTLVVEISDPAQATIEVLDAQGKVIITQKADAEKVEISVVPGKGTLHVAKKDFELFTKEFSLVSGKQETIKVKLVPVWQDLFNGKTLDGWRVGGDATWTISNGTICGGGQGNGVLLSQQEFGDFELQTDVKINSAGNSGVSFRVAPEATSDQLLTGGNVFLCSPGHRQRKARRRRVSAHRRSIWVCQRSREPYSRRSVVPFGSHCQR